MNGIDISNYQSGIDLNKVPCDFVIVKATQGKSFTSPSFSAQMNGANGAGKLLGVYHYIDGSGADAEMRHFRDAISPWIGKAIICLDWEETQNSQWGNASYLEQCIKRIKELTGKTITVYTGPYERDAWAVADRYGCNHWVAEYASDNVINGYQSKPWNEGAYACLIRQYSGNGRLSGYNGDIDLNKAYCTRDQWLGLAGVGAVKPTNPETYTIHLQAMSNGKVLPEVTNNSDNAGIDAPMQYLSAWADKGTLEVQARTRSGWLPSLRNPKNIKDAKSGSVGDGSPITGLRMYYHSPNGDRAVHYRVKTANGWLPWMIDHKDTGGSKDDFAGDGTPIYRVEAYIGGLG